MGGLGDVGDVCLALTYANQAWLLINWSFLNAASITPKEEINIAPSRRMDGVCSGRLETYLHSRLQLRACWEDLMWEELDHHCKRIRRYANSYRPDVNLQMYYKFRTKTEAFALVGLIKNNHQSLRGNGEVSIPIIIYHFKCCDFWVIKIVFQCNAAFCLQFYNSIIL